MFGFDPYHVLLATAGLAIIVSYWSRTCRFGSSRPWRICRVRMGAWHA